jgi:UDP-N-acetylglucosamine 2-epimerase (non-hydrolysing)
MNIITVTGIRPDFIRMSEVFRLLDSDPNINHTLIHTGQHYDKLLSDVFFQELEIRKPDYNLEIGGEGKEHFHQNAELTVKLIELIRSERLEPDWVIFLGDSNSVLVAPSLKKEGINVAHIEAGMRSGDRRMLEEVNRIVCDHSSELLFTYHDDYSDNLFQENIPRSKVVNVGNTIVEVAKKHAKNMLLRPKKNDIIILDIHRPENFKDPARLQAIFNWARDLSVEFNTPCFSLEFPRTYSYIDLYGINTYHVERVGLMPYKEYIEAVYDSLFVISDSGTAQEEPAILGTPVLVPREYTERPQSYETLCSKYLPVDYGDVEFMEIVDFIVNVSKNMCSDWLGCGNTSVEIISHLKSRV